LLMYFFNWKFSSQTFISKQLQWHWIFTFNFHLFPLSAAH
jgi:hypothetical protein